MIQMTDQEHATILAALRLWQRTIDKNLLPEYIVATDMGTVSPMPTIELEALCWKVNTRGLLWGAEDADSSAA